MISLLLYDIFRFGFALIFVGLHGALMLGLFREYRRDAQADAPQENLPKVSVIIPIHNEGPHLAKLLDSLAAQQYPQAEFIFVDDRSSDESPALLRRFALPCTIITLEDNPGPNHKQYALERGIETASGTFLLFTDGDCEVPPGWIFAMTSRMIDPRIGVILGPVFKRPGGTSFFHHYQCFDHAVRYMYLAGSTGLGAAGGGFGNNLMLHRAALDAIGGYPELPTSPTEDAVLISQIRRRSEYRIRAALGGDLFVFTKGEDSWKNLIHQTLRWNNGGLFSPDAATRFHFRFLMIAIALGILAIPFLFFFPSLWTLTGAVLLSMTMNTIATLKLFGSALPRGGLRYGVQVLFTPLYFTVLTILGFCGFKSRWKGSPVER